ncbi:flavin-containing monooxygenase [Jongsikchunia kroppenstedtii]|uniref:flavin-containing monooxygenase n=1 Tax=Jongsikchunia kroppenstedtii TaxID=1121721 RepID=UPI000399FFAF|nr:NAD(P)/FAD-dependent oxidoreductase [Jongsikchunia kroppenstedtii]
MSDESDQSRVEHRDLLIVGAGLSGIDAAYRVANEFPGLSYEILERRDRVGGTWDLFTYPGVRSDSDMFTLSLPFEPWRGAKQIADGPDIRDYIEDTASKHGIDRRIHFGTTVRSASWDSAAQRWTVVAENGSGTVEYRTRFLYLCTGYYDYDDGYTPDFPGISDYRGQVIHPQHWPDGEDFTGKRVVVIGSGATAVTLAPALARSGARVQMLQRSPSWVYPVPTVGVFPDLARKLLPAQAAHDLVRLKNAWWTATIYQICSKFPNYSRRLLTKKMAKKLPADYDLAVHFNPAYNPWEQRLCADADGVLFDEIASGDVEMVTDHIDTFTENGIRLKSGRELEADVVVTATGLRLQAFGGITLTVDGEEVVPGERFVYKGYLLDGVPNFGWSVGYTNASWTLRADLSARALVRLMSYMRSNGYQVAYPHRGDKPIEARPFFNLSSGYLQREGHVMPKSGTERPWAIEHHFFADAWAHRRDHITLSMVFAH